MNMKTEVLVFGYPIYKTDDKNVGIEGSFQGGNYRLYKVKTLSILEAGVYAIFASTITVFTAGLALLSSSVRNMWSYAFNCQSKVLEMDGYQTKNKKFFEKIEQYLSKNQGDQVSDGVRVVATISALTLTILSGGIALFFSSVREMWSIALSNIRVDDEMIKQNDHYYEFYRHKRVKSQSAYLISAFTVTMMTSGLALFSSTVRNMWSVGFSGIQKYKSYLDVHVIDEIKATLVNP